MSDAIAPIFSVTDSAGLFAMASLSLALDARSSNSLSESATGPSANHHDSVVTNSLRPRPPFRRHVRFLSHLLIPPPKQIHEHRPPRISRGTRRHRQVQSRLTALIRRRFRRPRRRRERRRHIERVQIPGVQLVERRARRHGIVAPEFADGWPVGSSPSGGLDMRRRVGVVEVLDVLNGREGVSVLVLEVVDDAESSSPDDGDVETSVR